MTSLPEPELVYAGIFRRFFAFLADCAVLVLFAFITAVNVLPGHDASPHAVKALARLTLIFWLVYMIAAPYFTGMTLGKYLLGIEIRSSRPDHARPAIWELAMRETVFRWMSLILFLGYIPAFNDPRHRSWSDRWANTVVVRRTGKPRRWVVWAFVLIMLAILTLIWLTTLFFLAYRT